MIWRSLRVTCSCRHRTDQKAYARVVLCPWWPSLLHQAAGVMPCVHLSSADLDAAVQTLSAAARQAGCPCCSNVPHAKAWCSCRKPLASNPSARCCSSRGCQAASAQLSHTRWPWLSCSSPALPRPPLVLPHSSKVGSSRSMRMRLEAVPACLPDSIRLKRGLPSPLCRLLELGPAAAHGSRCLAQLAAFTRARQACLDAGQQPQAASPQHPSGRDQQQHQAAAPQHPSGRDQQPGSTQSHQAVQGSSQDAAHESPASSGRPGEEGSPGSGQAPGVLSAAAALQRMSLYMRSAGR